MFAFGLHKQFLKTEILGLHLTEAIPHKLDDVSPARPPLTYQVSYVLVSYTLNVTVHWKAVEQYFTVVTVNPLNPRVKPWVIQSFLTFNSMERTLNCDHSLERC